MDSHTRPNWKRSALLTIDLQEDFSREGAPAYVMGTADIIPPVSRLTTHYRNRGYPIFHLVRLYRRDGSNVDLCRKQAIEEDKKMVTPGTEGAELVCELKPDSSINLDHRLLLDGGFQKIGKGEWIVYKPRWGAFYKTGLDKKLRSLQVDTLVISGCNFPNCPRATVYEASERDFRVILAKDAVSGLYMRGEKELSDIGISLLQTREITEKVRSTLLSSDKQE